MSTMAEVVAAHQPTNMSRERYCTCGTFIGDWATTEELAEHVATELAKAGYGKLEDLTPVGFLDSIRGDAWAEGYLRGQYPWKTETQEVDPIPEGISPPEHGRNANPYPRSRS